MKPLRPRAGGRRRRSGRRGRVGGEVDGLVDAEAVLAEAADGEQAVVVGADVDVGLAAEVLDMADGAGDGAGLAAEVEVLGADAEGLAGRAERRRRRGSSSAGEPMKPATKVLAGSL